MNLEECILVREGLGLLLNPAKKSAKSQVLKIAENSKNIFSKLYANKSILINEKPQFLLYADDIVLLDNCENFRKTNFVFMLHRQEKMEFESLVNKKQYGEYIVVSVNDAKNLINKTKLDSFMA